MIELVYYLPPLRLFRRLLLRPWVVQPFLAAAAKETMYMAKETYAKNRDLLGRGRRCLFGLCLRIWQKRPCVWQKRPMPKKETFLAAAAAAFSAFAWAAFSALRCAIRTHMGQMRPVLGHIWDIWGQYYNTFGTYDHTHTIYIIYMHIYIYIYMRYVYIYFAHIWDK